jgi:hypothetical protein
LFKGTIYKVSTMSNFKTFLCVASLSSFSWGCSTPFEPNMQSESLKQNTVVSGTPSLSGYSGIGKKDKMSVCLGRGADATFNQSESANLSIAIVSTGGDDKGSESENTGEEEMSGRTPGVLISREIFYRVCELYTNLDLDKKEAIGLFKSALGVVSQGWLKEGSNTNITISDTLQTQQQTSAKFIAPVDATKTQKSGANGTDGADATGTDATDAAGTDSTDAEGTDSTDAAGTDSTDAEGTDSTDAAGTDSTDTEGTDSTDAAGTDSTDAAGTDSTDAAGTDSSDTTVTDIIQKLKQ